MENYANDNVVKVLVANKVDKNEIKRVISSEDGQKLAKQLDISYFETSAKSGQNIAEMFSSLLLEIDIRWPVS